MMKRMMFVVAAVVLARMAVGQVPAPAPASEKKGDSFVLRINCGSDKDWTDAKGNKWDADREYEKGKWGAIGGDIVDRGSIKIDGTDIEHIYQTERYGASEYKVTCPNGKYKVTLHFAETYEQTTDAGQRVFAIAINGKEVVPELDPVKMAGGKQFKAVVKTFDAEVVKGVLTIALTDKAGTTEINGIEVIQQP